ncbi:GNAT family N-acetyltransferase [Catellatospora sp. KI3]|uniref:GNAT family N-acetyltransferase n=1 Tax=Catellatospora sp. KI3 TaxID=3041620 RepID=UPI00248247D7|nr:GNAT family N-acetyltransferase [Catellatospora sp. KI3]MDI1459447.1 GNAT family N-acetyltransferase [Catellatospora sp. KI3]
MRYEDVSGRGGVIRETGRLVIREWADTAADVDRTFDIYRRDEVTRWLGMPVPLTTREQARAAVLRRIEGYAAQPGYGLWAVQVRDTGLVAGSVALKPLPEPDDGVPGAGEVEIAWHLHPDSWGHGYATEAARVLLEYAFAQLALPEVHAIAKPDNAPSLAVMRRLGMTRLGRTSRWYAMPAEHYVAHP